MSAFDRSRFSPAQAETVAQVRAWAHEPGGPQLFPLVGYAGMGKTSLARALAQEVGGQVADMAFTGKAALVMRRSGCRHAATIHSSTYAVDEEEDARTEFVLGPDGAAAQADLIVVDECSMVDEGLATDHLSFRKRGLMLGDPAQLPRVKGAGFFTEARPTPC